MRKKHMSGDWADEAVLVAHADFERVAGGVSLFGGMN